MVLYEVCKKSELQFNLAGAAREAPCTTVLPRHAMQGAAHKADIGHAFSSPSSQP